MKPRAIAATAPYGVFACCASVHFAAFRHSHSLVLTSVGYVSQKALGVGEGMPEGTGAKIFSSVISPKRHPQEHSKMVSDSKS